MKRNNLSNYIVKRCAAGLLMVILIAWAPWWMIVAGAMVFLFVYNSYYEIIAWGLCMDELYGSAHPFPYSLAATITAAILLVGVYFLKKRLAFY